MSKTSSRSVDAVPVGNAIAPQRSSEAGRGSRLWHSPLTLPAALLQRALPERRLGCSAGGHAARGRWSISSDGSRPVGQPV